MFYSRQWAKKVHMQLCAFIVAHTQMVFEVKYLVFGFMRRLCKIAHIGCYRR